MRLLVLGGTIFLGPHVVEAARARGHAVTIFHRGRHEADRPDDVERVIGDRDGGLDALGDRRFDAVVDTCGYVPRIVGDSARRLADACERYMFVSSLSVYADDDTPGQDETAPVIELPDPTVEQVTGETYGGLKALCERAAEEAMPGRTLAVRPGLIVGPLDPTDRFTYWPVRLARGGDVLAPAPAETPVEFTDGRDLAAFLVRCAEDGTTGTVDVSGPEPRPSIGAFLETCRAVAGTDATIHWADEAFLEEHGVAPWSDLPLFAGAEANRALAGRDGSRARAAGISFRPMEETVRDTLAWARTRPADHAMRAGLDPAREAELLERLA